MKINKKILILLIYKNSVELIVLYKKSIIKVVCVKKLRKNNFLIVQILQTEIETRLKNIPNSVYF